MKISRGAPSGVVANGRVPRFWNYNSYGSWSPTDAPELQVCVRGAAVTVASDYSKRRHVVRLVTPGGTQLLLQADTHTAMSTWLQTLHQHANSQPPPPQPPHAMQEDDLLGQDDLSLPTDTASIASSKGSLLTPDTTTTSTTPSTATTATSTFSSPSTTTLTTSSTGSSPPSAKTSRKLGALRTHSPTGQSPQTKTRKSAGGGAHYLDGSGSEKSKTWKGLIGKRLKKMQGSTPTSSVATYPPGASFGVPLSLCPMSEKHGYLVPLAVGICVDIIEERGLNTQGIYRIPGNKAAVTHLTEMVNRGRQAIDFTDQRWSDVNVISSLLKQFFQRLPEPLIPNDLYPLFLQASQNSDPRERLLELRILVHELPESHLETLRLLSLHLQRVVSCSASNKMDVHNLAIVFGPTLVRATHDNMHKMVKDMPHQCRIVEALISQASWFFSDDVTDDMGVPPLPEGALPLLPDASPLTETDPASTQALLDNALKLQPPSNGHQKSDSKKELVSSIISAASRKVNKSRGRRSGQDIENEWSSRDAERSRDGGETVVDNRSRDSETLRDMESRSREGDCLSQRSSHSDIAMSLDATPKSSRSVSKTSSCSADSVASAFHNSIQDAYSSVRLRKDANARSSLDNELLCSNNSAGGIYNSINDNSDLFTPTNRSIHDNSRTTSMPVNTSTDSSSLVSSLGLSTPNIMNDRSRGSSAVSSRPVSTYETSSVSSVYGPKPSYSDGIAIRSYRDLSANTQERIRRFEEETRAMLERDPSKQQRRLSTRLEFDRETLEEAWQKAKRDLEEEDLLDLMADNPSEVVQRIAREGGYTQSPGGGLSTTSSSSLSSGTIRHNTPTLSDNNNRSLSPACAPYSLPYTTTNDYVKQVTNKVVLTNNNINKQTPQKLTPVVASLPSALLAYPQQGITTNINNLKLKLTDHSKQDVIGPKQQQNFPVDAKLGLDVCTPVSKELGVASSSQEELNDRINNNNSSPVKSPERTNDSQSPVDDLSSMSVLQKIRKLETEAAKGSVESLSKEDPPISSSSGAKILEDTISTTGCDETVPGSLVSESSVASSLTLPNKTTESLQATEPATDAPDQSLAVDALVDSLMPPALDSCRLNEVSNSGVTVPDTKSDCEVTNNNYEDSHTSSAVSSPSPVSSDNRLDINTATTAPSSTLSEINCLQPSISSTCSTGPNSLDSSDGLRSIAWPPATKSEVSVLNSLPLFPLLGPLLSTDLHISDSSLNEKSKKVSPSNRLAGFINSKKNTLTGDSSKNVSLLSYKSTPTLVHCESEPQLNSLFPRSSSGYLTPTIVENFSTDSIPGRCAIPTSRPLPPSGADPPVSRHVSSSSAFPSRTRSANTAVLHHIIPQRLYPSPRPLRRGSSTESLPPSSSHLSSCGSFPLVSAVASKPSSACVVATRPHYPRSSHLHSGSTGDTYTSQPDLFTIHTTPLSSTRRDQISLEYDKDGPSSDLGLDSSYHTDSLSSGKDHQEDGSDLLSAITATFEKMRSEGAGDVQGVSPMVRREEQDSLIWREETPDDGWREHDGDRTGGSARAGGGECKLYRDPSLHRRTPHHTPIRGGGGRQSNLTEPTVGVTHSRSPTLRKAARASLDNKPTVTVKRTDSLTKSEKTENNMKEKSEKRGRDQKRPEIFEDIHEKKSKEMRHSGQTELSRSTINDAGKGEAVMRTRRLSTDVRHRRHNVRELKEKFEQSQPISESGNVSLNTSNNNSTNSSGNNGGGRRSGGRKSRSNIKRRHTVGGTKDLGKVMALQKALLQWQLMQGNHQSDIMQHPQLTSNLPPETLEKLMSIEPWEARERLGASSPDLPNLLEFLLLPGQEQEQHRRLSVRDPWALQPVLESHV